MTTAAACATPRLYALDNLRALMMWLGIVLHVCVIYVAGDAVLPWRDTTRTPVADLLLGFIHSFRMPVFFILAGFFVALLLRSRGPAGMARHRAIRLGIPFAIFWPPVFMACVALGLLFMNRMALGTWGFDPRAMDIAPWAPRGPNTMHMWFLWMLLWMCLACAAVARWAGGPWLGVLGNALHRLGRSAWGPVLLTMPLVLAGLAYPHGLIKPSGFFLPPLPEWAHSGLFFVFGLALFHHQGELFALYRKRWAAYAAAGLVSFLAAGALMERHAPDIAFSYAYNLTSWWWSFALLGLALKLLDSRRAWLSYLADSSYWVYLVHMPLTIGFGLLLYGLAIHPLAKIGINVAATTVVCLGTYHVFVRFTWLGALLNGKRQAPGAKAQDLEYLKAS
jgi:glucan biosynthesis protein C